MIREPFPVEIFSKNLLLQAISHSALSLTTETWKMMAPGKGFGCPWPRRCRLLQDFSAANFLLFLSKSTVWQEIKPHEPKNNKLPTLWAHTTRQHFANVRIQRCQNISETKVRPYLNRDRWKCGGPLGFESTPQWRCIATPAYSTQLLSLFCRNLGIKCEDGFCCKPSMATSPAISLFHFLASIGF